MDEKKLRKWLKEEREHARRESELREPDSPDWYAWNAHLQALLTVLDYISEQEPTERGKHLFERSNLCWPPEEIAYQARNISRAFLDEEDAHLDTPMAEYDNWVEHAHRVCAWYGWELIDVQHSGAFVCNISYQDVVNGVYWIRKFDSAHKGSI